MVVSLVLVSLVAVILIVTGVKKMPGIGIIAAVVIIGGAAWWRNSGLHGLGFFAPNNWGMTLLVSLVCGVVFQMFSTVLIEPWCDRVTQSVTDHSVFEALRGNIKSLITWLATVWILVAFLEESIFRGFIMSELANVTGKSFIAIIFNLVISSIVFGLAHWYQGKSGVLSTAIVGGLLGLLFVWSGFNLWLPVLTHGFIDTLGLTMIYANVDIAVKERLKVSKI